MLKTALCFGVEVFGGVSFDGIKEPEQDCDPWQISVQPEDHPVASRGVDVLIGAEGKHVTVPGFRWAGNRVVVGVENVVFTCLLMMTILIQLISLS